MQMKRAITLVIFCIGLYPNPTVAQGQFFLINQSYYESLQQGWQNTLVACIAIRVIETQEGIISVREYYSAHSDGTVKSTNYKTYTYRFDPASKKFKLRCNEQEGSCFLCHKHTNNGYHWIQVDEFGDFIKFKKCGVAKSIHKFLPADIRYWLR